MRILVVEDERLLADAIAAGLRRQAMAVDVVYDGDSALEHATVNEYDVIVLDRDLPVLSGDAVCSAVTAASGTTRILMLTAATAVVERVTGLGLGADDYLTKPFAFAELVARVQALARRACPLSRRYWSVLVSGSIRTNGRSNVTVCRYRCRARSSRSSLSCCAQTVVWCRLSSCWRRRGTRTSTRSPVSSDTRS